MLGRWIERYPIVSIEDPLAEDDPEGFRRFTRGVWRALQVIGDDFLVTNAARVREAAAGGALQRRADQAEPGGHRSPRPRRRSTRRKAAGFGTIVSARSGETEDVTIAHLAVGWNAGQLKVGSFARSERMAKWNEVLRIEEALGPGARFARPFG